MDYKILCKFILVLLHFIYLPHSNMLALSSCNKKFTKYFAKIFTLVSISLWYQYTFLNYIKFFIVTFFKSQKPKSKIH